MLQCQNYMMGIMINRVRVNTNDKILNQRPDIGVKEILKDDTFTQHPFGFSGSNVTLYLISLSNNSLLQLVPIHQGIFLI